MRMSYAIARSTRLSYNHYALRRNLWITYRDKTQRRLYEILQCSSFAPIAMTIPPHPTDPTKPTKLQVIELAEKGKPHVLMDSPASPYPR